MTPDVDKANLAEPLLTRAGIVAVVGAVLTFATSFGLDLDAGQTAAILGLVTVLSPFVLAAWARRKVTPYAGVAALVGSDGGLVAGPAAVQATGVPVNLMLERADPAYQIHVEGGPDLDGPAPRQDPGALF